MGEKENMPGLGWSIDGILLRVERETKTIPTAKYLDIAISVARKAEALEKKANELPNVYVSEKLKLTQEAIEKYKEAFEYLLKSIYAGEDVLLQLETLKRAISKSANLRTRILMALSVHGEMKVKELAELLGKDESTISKSLKYLIEAGYVERGENGLRLRKGVFEKFLEVFDSAYNRLEEEL